MTFHLDELPIKLPDLIELLDRPKVVVLHRRSIFEQYASLKLAERHGVWHVKGRPRDVRPTWLDPDDCLAFAARERRMWRENLDVLQGYPTHIVSYEQLTLRPAQTMAGVFDYLGVRPVRARSRYVKIDNKPLAQKLLNYDHLQGLEIPQQMTLSLDQARRVLQTAA